MNRKMKKARTQIERKLFSIFDKSFAQKIIRGRGLTRYAAFTTTCIMYLKFDSQMQVRCILLLQDGTDVVVKEVFPGDSVHSLLSILDVITVRYAFHSHLPSDSASACLCIHCTLIST